MRQGGPRAFCFFALVEVGGDGCGEPSFFTRVSGEKKDTQRRRDGAANPHPGRALTQRGKGGVCFLFLDTQAQFVVRRGVVTKEKEEEEGFMRTTRPHTQCCLLSWWWDATPSMPVPSI